jgi:hypothetical protein
MGVLDRIAASRRMALGRVHKDPGPKCKARHAGRWGLSPVSSLRRMDRKDRGGVRTITIIGSMASLVRNRDAASPRMARNLVLADRGALIANLVAVLVVRSSVASPKAVLSAARSNVALDSDAVLGSSADRRGRTPWTRAGTDSVMTGVKRAGRISASSRVVARRRMVVVISVAVPMARNPLLRGPVGMAGMAAASMKIG